jgi:hypothetical protein
MKSKKICSVLFVAGVLFYAISFMATKPIESINDDPCYIAIQNKFASDTSIGNHAFWDFGSKDTIILRGDTLLPADWNRITDTICKVYKDNCVNGNNKPILVINWRDTSRSNWDTRFGKKILFKFCP